MNSQQKQPWFTWMLALTGMVLLYALYKQTPTTWQPRWVTFAVVAVELAGLAYVVYFKPVTVQLLVLSAMLFIGVEHALLISPFLILPKLIWIGYQKRFANWWRGPEKWILAFIGYGVLVFLISLLHDFYFLRLPLWIGTTCSGLLWFLYFRQYDYSVDYTRAILGFISILVVLQMPIILLQSITLRDSLPYDWTLGSIGDPHYIGYYCVLACVVLIGHVIVDKEGPLTKFFSFKILGILGAFLFLLLLSDTKIIVLALLIGFVIFLLLLVVTKGKHHIRGKRLWFCLVPAIVLVIGVLPLGDLYFKLFFPNAKPLSEIFQQHIQDDQQNHKYMLYKRVFVDHLNDDQVMWFIGTGPGSLGSRASNVLASDVLYKRAGRKLPFIPAHASMWVKRYMADLYTPEFAIPHRISASLSDPFAGIISLKGELGLPGLFLWLGIVAAMVWALIKRMGHFQDQRLRAYAIGVGVALCGWPFMLLIDNYHESPYITFLCLALAAVLLQSKPTLKETP